MKTARKALNIIYALIDILGINALFRYLNRDKAVVLWYHGVCDDDFKLLKGYDERHVPVSKFEKQLEYLKRKGYKFLTMSEFMDRIENGHDVGRCAVLTFDDGFKNIVRNAYPLMKKYDARGCFYLVSDLIGTENLLWTDLVETVLRENNERDFKIEIKGSQLRLSTGSKSAREKSMLTLKRKLRAIPNVEREAEIQKLRGRFNGNAPHEFKFSSWDEIASINRSILEIGSHTRTHPNLPALTTTSEVTQEIGGSKNVIEAKLKDKVDHFCYPAGAYDNRAVAEVKQSGYKSAVTTLPGLNKGGVDRYLIKRVVVTESMAAFKAYVSGFYLFLRKLAKFGRG